MIRKMMFVFLAGLVFASPAFHAAAEEREKVLIELESGRVVIELRSDLAPRHVERIKELAGQGFYDGQIFHRVIRGFMAQTGDPTGTGRGGSEEPDLKAEFSDAPFRRGTVGMARTSDPDSANSQFFICTADAGWLNGQYTVWGEVVEGMEHVDALPAGEPPASPGRIVRMGLVGSDEGEASEDPLEGGESEEGSFF